MLLTTYVALLDKIALHDDEIFHEFLEKLDKLCRENPKHPGLFEISEHVGKARVSLNFRWLETNYALNMQYPFSSRTEKELIQLGSKIEDFLAKAKRLI